MITGLHDPALAAKAQLFIDECQREVPLDEPARAIGGYEKLIAAQDVFFAEDDVEVQGGVR